MDWTQIPSTIVDESEPIAEEFVEYRYHKSGVALNGDQSIKLKTESLDVFHDMSRAYIRVKCRVLDNADATTVINTTLNENAFSIFKGMRYYQSGALIESVDLPAYCTQISNLRDMSTDFIGKQAPMQWFYPHVEDSDITPVPALAVPFDAAGNRANLVMLQDFLADHGKNLPDRSPADISFQKRLARTHDGTNTKFIYINLPLKAVFGSLAVNKPVRGLQHEFELVRQNDVGLILESNANVAVGIRKLFIDEISLWCMRLQPNFKTLARIEKQLSSNKAGLWSFPTMSGQMNTYAGATTQGTWRLNTASSRPLQVFVALLNDARITKDPTTGLNGTTPMCFDTLNLRSMELRVDGKSYPAEPFNVNFESDDYARAYLEFNKTLQSDLDFDGDVALSYDKFKSCYPIMSFDIAPALSEKLFDNVSAHDIELRWALGGANANPYHIVAVIRAEKRMEVSGVAGRLALKSA